MFMVGGVVFCDFLSAIGCASQFRPATPVFLRLRNVRVGGYGPLPLDVKQLGQLNNSTTTLACFEVIIIDEVRSKPAMVRMLSVCFISRFNRRGIPTGPARL